MKPKEPKCISAFPTFNERGDRYQIGGFNGAEICRSLEHEPFEVVENVRRDPSTFSAPALSSPINCKWDCGYHPESIKH